MRSFAGFSEDIADRRLALKQRQADQAASVKEKGAGVQQAAGERLAAQREKAAQAAQNADKTRQAIKDMRKASEDARK